MSSWDIIEKGRNDRPAELDPAIRHRAALTICGMAGEATVARPVLEALGLVEPLTRSPQGRRYR
jgi:hypothetical protein